MMYNNEEKIEREKKVLDFLKKKFNWVVYLILGGIIWINVYIRTLPMKINPSTGNPGLWDITRNNWTLGPDLDPFFFLRWAKTIVEQGALPAIDNMRYVPVGYETLNSTTLLPHLIASLYKFLHFFIDKVTVEYAAVIFPVIVSIFTTIAFFLLVKKIFEGKGKKISSIIALIASLFLVTLPSLLVRTIAGIPEKESIGFGLMFFAFYFFLSAWKSKKIKNALFLSIFAGLFTALMGLIWGGVVFIYITIAITGFIAFVLGKIGKKELIVYSCWIFSSMIFWIPFTLRISLKGFLISSTSGIAIIVWFFMLIYFIIFKTKIKNLKLLQNPKINKIPKTIQVMIIALLILVFLVSILLGPQAIIDFGGEIISKLSHPYSDRLSFTVAENAQPFFNNWKQSFGPIIKNIPIFFWLFFIGTIILFYEMIKNLGKEKIILLIGYVLFLFSIIFSRTSSQSVLNGESGLSIFVYIMGFVILISSACYVSYKTKEKEILKNIRFEYIFVFSLVFVGIIAARSAVRLIMVLAPIAVIPISYIAVTSIVNAMKEKRDLIKLFSVIFAILILILVPYTLYYNYKVSEATGNALIPNQYTYQWQNAMGWVRENTSKDAVFSSWWDYGYWIQTMGERATVLDGGNSIKYWNYLMGRHVLTANNESEALEFLYNHNVTHLLIDSTEIGKYGAFSNIGSDENYDKLSWIGNFLLDESQTQETKNKTIIFYFGGVALDEDLIIDGVILPAKVAGVGAIVISIDVEEGFEQPYIIIIYKENKYKVNLRYLFYDGELIDFGSGIEGSAYLFPRIIQRSGQTIDVNLRGAAMFLSPRNMRALWIRLYLLEEGENFKLIHTESAEFVKVIRSKELKIGEIVYFNGVQGPIKIWEVNYVGNETYNKEYVQKNFPERILERVIQK